MVKLSVVIPSYNAERYVERTIQSALSLGPDVQIIAVNDGSTDSTAQILASFEPEIEVVTQVNQGLPAARNAGLVHAKGEYTLFLDADDTVLPCMAEVVNDAINSSTPPDVLYTNYNRIDENDQFLESVTCIDISADPFRFLSKQNHLAVPATVCRTSTIRELGGFDISFRASEDWEMWLREALAGKRFFLNPTIAANYRQTPGSMSKSFGRMFRSTLKIESKFKEAFKKVDEGNRFVRLDHTLDRDLPLIYGMDTNDSKLKKRMTRLKTGFSLCVKDPVLALHFGRRFLNRIALVSKKVIRN
jgi:glycosyltransferase involved in cell wall biosynthesis